MTDKRKLDADKLYEVVCTLIGPIEPMGEHNLDAQRLLNIKVMTELIDFLLDDVQRVTRFNDRPEASIKLISHHAYQFIRETVQRD